MAGTSNGLNVSITDTEQLNTISIVSRMLLGAIGSRFAFEEPHERILAQAQHSINDAVGVQSDRMQQNAQNFLPRIQRSTKITVSYSQ
jgi:hypothetical protein